MSLRAGFGKFAFGMGASCSIAHGSSFFARAFYATSKARMESWGPWEVGGAMTIYMVVVLGIGAPIQVGMGSLDPQGWINLKSNVLQDPKDKKGERKAITFIGRIVVRSHHIQDDLTDVELLADENDMNEPSKWSTYLDLMGRWVEWIGEESSKEPCLLREANDGDVRRQWVRSATKTVWVASSSPLVRACTICEKKKMQALSHSMSSTHQMDLEETRKDWSYIITLKVRPVTMKCMFT